MQSGDWVLVPVVVTLSLICWTRFPALLRYLVRDDIGTFPIDQLINKSKLQKLGLKHNIHDVLS